MRDFSPYDLDSNTLLTINKGTKEEAFCGGVNVCKEILERQDSIVNMQMGVINKLKGELTKQQVVTGMLVFIVIIETVYIFLK